MTSRGRSGVWLLVLLTGAGVLLRLPELFALAGGLATALGLGWFSVRRSQELDIERLLETPTITASHSLVSLIAFTNRASYPFRGGDVIDRIARVDRNGTEQELVLRDVRAPYIAPSSQVATTSEVRDLRRGEYVLGPLRLVRRDPFGLWRKESAESKTDTALVLPRVHDLLGGATGKRDQAPARTSDASLSSSIAFDRLRDYVVGDDLRRVHWRTSARTEKLMVRETLDEIIDDVVIALDDELRGVDERGRGERYELHIEIAASIAQYAATIGLPCRLFTSTGLTAEQRGGELSMELLRTLALAEPSDVGLRSLASGVSAKPGRPGGRLFVIAAGGADSLATADVRAAATDLARRVPRAHLLEVGTSEQTEERQRGLRIWGVPDLVSLMTIWPTVERS